MKTAVRKIIIFVLIISCIYMGLVILGIAIGDQYSEQYQAALLDKVNRLESIKGPKIVLVGNSNICFGIDSAAVEEEFGIPVVDTGLHGGLGNAFSERLAEVNLSEGDIVVVMHTDFEDEGTIPEPDLLWTTLGWNKDLWKLVKRQDFLCLLKSFPNYLLGSIERKITEKTEKEREEVTCYRRDNFNEYGDIINRYSDSYTFDEDSVVVPGINSTCVDRLNRLNERIEKKGATLLVAAYPIGAGEYTPSSQEYEEFEDNLRSVLECDIISTYTDYFIPYSLFYNSKYHLNEEGTKIRTNLFIQDLHNWMETRSR